jgi:hypothetical protein
MALRRADLDDLSSPLREFFTAIYWLATVRDTLVYLLILGVGVACLVVGSRLAHVVGVVLLIFCAAVAAWTLRKHLANLGRR